MQIPEVDRTTIPISGTDDRLPVRRIYCVGQNYADHAREMGSDPTRAAPFFFSKPADAVVESGSLIAFPSQTDNLHHEVELVIALGGGGSNIDVADASELIFGYAVGLDLTRRDLQAVAKAAGRPWDLAKGFDQSAPVGAIRRGVPPVSGTIELTIGDEVRQHGDLSEMIWSVDEIIATLSKFVMLQAGDLIYTGTPAGVGPIRPGETVRCSVADAEPLEVRFGTD